MVSRTVLGNCDRRAGKIKEGRFDAIANAKTQRKSKHDANANANANARKRRAGEKMLRLFGGRVRLYIPCLVIYSKGHEATDESCVLGVKVVGHVTIVVKWRVWRVG